MTLSAVCVVFSGSNRTRLLRHGMAGHITEIVGLSWIENPWGRSSRRRRLSQPPATGVAPGVGDCPGATDAETTRNNAASASRFTVPLSLPGSMLPRKTEQAFAKRHGSAGARSVGGVGGPFEAPH